MRSFLRLACKSFTFHGEASHAHKMIQIASEIRANIARYVEEPGICFGNV